MRIVSALLASLMLTGALTCTAPAAEASARQSAPLLQDIERYLLLYTATGDDRFLVRLDSLSVVFESQLDAQKQAKALKDIWQLHQQTLKKVRDAYSKKGIDLKEALRQTREVAELFDSFLMSTPDNAPTMIGELRELALLEARGANRKLLDEPLTTDSRRIDTLLTSLQGHLDALPDSPERTRLLAHWAYLRKSQVAAGTLLYPFNAQIEYLSSHLPQG
ncbi:hypothetical protein [Pseudomonas nicosulfuronedens]